MKKLQRSPYRINHVFLFDTLDQFPYNFWKLIIIKKEFMNKCLLLMVSITFSLRAMDITEITSESSPHVYEEIITEPKPSTNIFPAEAMEEIRSLVQNITRTATTNVVYFDRNERDKQQITALKKALNPSSHGIQIVDGLRKQKSPKRKQRNIYISFMQ